MFDEAMDPRDAGLLELSRRLDAYADAHPTNVVLLVDTYDTLTGVTRAIETGRRLRERGHDLAAIRLDSGDLAYLSIEARRMLDKLRDRSSPYPSATFDSRVLTRWWP